MKGTIRFYTLRGHEVSMSESDYIGIALQDEFLAAYDFDHAVRNSELIKVVEKMFDDREYDLEYGNQFIDLERDRIAKQVARRYHMTSEEVIEAYYDFWEELRDYPCKEYPIVGVGYY